MIDSHRLTNNYLDKLKEMDSFGYYLGTKQLLLHGSRKITKDGAVRSFES